MEKYIFDKSNGLWYELQGDYYIPSVTSSHLPVRDMAKDCLITLENILNSPSSASPFCIYYDTAIVFRESCPQDGQFPTDVRNEA